MEISRMNKSLAPHQLLQYKESSRQYLARVNVFFCCYRENKQVMRAREEALTKAREEFAQKVAAEKAAQLALQRMRVCPAGYQWLRQGQGWRCAGGSHFVSSAAVVAEMAHGSAAL